MEKTTEKFLRGSKLKQKTRYKVLIFALKCVII